MDTTPLTPVCPNCGKPLVAGAPKGLCPECLMKAGFETKAGDEPIGGKPAFVPSPVEEIAKLFPQLEIIALLGYGGMGVVYKARQPRLNRFVALKILLPEKQNDPQFAERFEREARALASLTHPNIVTVYDFGEVSGNFYLLMEFVDGVTLRQLFQAKKLSPAEALAIVPKICDALQYAHEQGIVHRDVKPENILIDKNGRVKIADFGIAKIMDQPAQDIPLTGVKDVVGTVHYMAPEQIEHPQAVDCRADIYSLGVVFYEMLTGELPIGKFLPPSQKAHTDARLDEVVMQALEKEPERRYQTADQMKTAVETIAVDAPPPPAAETPAPEIPAGDYALNIGHCLSRGWALVLGDFWRIVGVTALVLLLQWASFIVIIKSLVSGPLMGGLFLYFLKKIRGEQSTLGTAFSGFRKGFLALFLGSLVTIVLTFLGICCLVAPGIYLAVAWSFTLALVIDKQLGFWEAMSLSRRTIHKHWWKACWFIIILWLIKLAGTMVLGVGYLIAAPVAFAAMMYAYEDIFGSLQPSAVPTPVSPEVSTESANLRAWGWVLAVLLGLLVIGGGIVMLFFRQAAGQLQTSIATQITAKTAAPFAVQAAEQSPGAAKAELVDSNAFWNLLNDDQRVALQFTEHKYRNLFEVDDFNNLSDKERADQEKQFISTLYIGLNGPRSDDSYRAINSLAAMHSAKALPVLRKLALDRGTKLLRVEVSNRPRWMAVRALGIIGDQSATPKMIHLLYHNNSYVRWAAQLALVRLTGHNYSNDWKAWGSWWNWQNGQPPFTPETVRWWPGQAEADDLAETNAAADLNFLENARTKNPDSTEAASMIDTRDFSISGGGFTVATLADGLPAFSNKKYVWQGIPAKFRGWHYTKIKGGSHPQIHVQAKHNATLQLITAYDPSGVYPTGWERTDAEFHYSDGKNTGMIVFKRTLPAGAEINIPQENWSGCLVLLPDVITSAQPLKANTTTH